MNETPQKENGKKYLLQMKIMISVITELRGCSGRFYDETLFRKIEEIIHFYKNHHDRLF